MSDTDNTVDGNTNDIWDEIDKADMEKFKALIPQHYYPVEGFRKGWRQRMEGLAMVHEPYLLSEELSTTLPKHWSIWYEDYKRGYDAAENAILDTEANIIKPTGTFNAWI